MRPVKVIFLFCSVTPLSPFFLFRGERGISRNDSTRNVVFRENKSVASKQSRNTSSSVTTVKAGARLISLQPRVNDNLW